MEHFRAAARSLAMACLLFTAIPIRADEHSSGELTAKEIFAGLRSFYERTARSDGSFQPGIDPDYLGMSDTAYSDLAAVTYACTIHKTFGWTLPHESATVEFLQSRQKPTGEFFNIAGTVDPQSPEGQVYNTTQALVALHALGAKPKIIRSLFSKPFCVKTTKRSPRSRLASFHWPTCAPENQFPSRLTVRSALLMIQDEKGYLNDHVAATFHASHYYAGERE